MTAPITTPAEPLAPARPSRSSWWLACLLLLALPTALLWPSLCGDHVFLPFSAAVFPPFVHELDDARRAELSAGANLDVTEVTLTFGPEWQHARSQLAAGRLPQWNPHARFGAPLFASAVLGLTYPPNWLTFLALDFERGLALNAWLGLVLAALLMFGFLRHCGLAVAPATLGAAAFALSGTLSANLHHYQRLHSLAWLPGILWALSVQLRSCTRQRAVAFCATALTTALTWLAGFPPYAAAVTLLAALFATVKAIALNRGWRPAFGGLIGTYGALACGLLLAAVQLVPMLAFFPESNRPPNPTDAAVVAQAFDPMGWLGYVLPHPFGAPGSGAPYPSSPLAWWLFSRTEWGSGLPVGPNYNFIEYAVFPGGLVLVMAVVGLGSPARWVPLLGLLVLAWLATAGNPAAPVYSLPGVRSVPPMRFLGPACAMVAWLAGLGLTQLTRSPNRWPLNLARATSLTLALTCALGHVAVGWQSAAAWLTAMTPQLLSHYQPIYPGVTADMAANLLGPHMAAAQRHLLDNLLYGALAYTAVAVLLFVRNRPRVRPWWPVMIVVAAAAEVLVLAWPPNRGRPAQPLAAPALTQLRTARAESNGGFAVIRGSTSADLLPRALPPGLLLNDHIRDLHAYTFVDARSHALFRALYGDDFLIRDTWPPAFPDDARLELPLFDALGATYTLATEPMRHGGELLPTTPSRPFCVHRRPRALPRAYHVPELSWVADDDAAVTAMIAADYNPRRQVVVTVDQTIPRLPAAQPSAPPREVRFERDEPESIELAVGAGAPGYLVVSDALLSGWTATVDGVPQPIFRGNLFMRVLPLPAGSVRVTMSYATPGLRLGVALSGLALLTMLLVLLRRRPHTDRAEPANPRREAGIGTSIR